MTAGNHARHGSRFRTAVDALLWVGALLGVVCILGGLAAVLFGVRPMVVQSGSMSPAIPTGSLVLATSVPADRVDEGDVVSVIDARGTRITHRVVDARPVAAEDAGPVALTLRGDANPAPDSEPYVVASADRVVADVPYLGYFIAWASGPAGMFVLGGVAVALVLSLVRRRPETGADRPAEAGRDSQGKHARVLLVGAVVLAVAGAWAHPSVRPASTLAAFTDTVPVSSSFSTHAVPPTTLSCGGLGIASVTFTWTAVPGATGYTLHYGVNGASTITTTNTSRTVTSLVSGGTAWVTVHRSFGSITWSSAGSNKRSYTVAVVSLCS